MKARGEWNNYGRPHVQKPKNWDEVVENWQAGKITAVEAMRLTGMKKSSFYKYVKGGL